MILSRQFNINITENYIRNISVIDFFNQALGLTVSNDQKLSTAKYKTTINAVFTR